MNLSRFPSVDKRPLDLYKLKKAVDTRGGFEQVCKQKKWAEIGRDLGYSGKIMSSLSTSLKNSFQRWLFPYEQYLRVAKPGVQQQLETENGESPPSSSKRSPVNLDNQTFDARDSPVRPSVEGSLVEEAENDPLNKSIASVGAAQRSPATSGFTAVNSNPSGFSAINTTPGFVAVNGPPVKREAESEFTTTKGGSDNPPFSTKGTPDRSRQENGTKPIVNGNDSHQVKRALSIDSLGEGSQTDFGDLDVINGRKSKRLKKGK